MSDVKHTPGPWSLEVGDNTHRYSHVTDADDRTIHYKYGAGTSHDADKDEANARLITAAPSLLWALKLLAGSEQDALGMPLGERLHHARAAIAKAEGRSLSSAEGVAAPVSDAGPGRNNPSSLNKGEGR